MINLSINFGLIMLIAATYAVAVNFPRRGEMGFLTSLFMDIFSLNIVVHFLFHPHIQLNKKN